MRAELLARAAPPCHECDSAVQRVEAQWHRDDDGGWRPGPWFMICADGHGVPVEPLGLTLPGGATAAPLRAASRSRAPRARRSSAAG